SVISVGDRAVAERHYLLDAYPDDVLDIERSGEQLLGLGLWQCRQQMEMEERPGEVTGSSRGNLFEGVMHVGAVLHPEQPKRTFVQQQHGGTVWDRIGFERPVGHVEPFAFLQLRQDVRSITVRGVRGQSGYFRASQRLVAGLR